MHSCEAIQLSIDYIENNLDKNLSTKMLADMVGLSMFYYQRLFCRLVHKPVQEYIKLRRLAHSIELLNIPDKKSSILHLKLDTLVMPTILKHLKNLSVSRQINTERNVQH